MREGTASRSAAALPVASGREVSALLWRMLRGRRWALAGVLALFLVEAALALVFPLVTGSLVDAVIAAAGSGVPASFWVQPAILAASALAGAAVTWAGGVALARLVETVVAELREDYVAAALDLPRTMVDAAGTGDLVTRAGDDVARVSEALPTVLPRVAVSVFTLVLTGAGLAAIDPRFLLAFAVTVPFYALTVRWYLASAPTVYASERSAESVRAQHILGTLTQLPTVVAHRIGARQRRRIRDATWQTVRWAMRARIVQNRLFGRLNVAEAAGLLAVLATGIWLAATAQATPGQVTAAALLFLATIAPVEALLFVLDTAQSALAALARIVGVIRHPDAAGEAALGAPPRAGALVQLRGVGFAYRDGRPVLRDVSLAVPRGGSLAVVGPTGSGKTTLAALIAGIHAPARGAIDRSIPLERIVTVTQETHVFAGTLRENLTLAAPDATDAELHAALGSVRATSLLDLTADGLDTRVGHGGHALTAAQGQQLALARLVLADPELAILDEATAEADSADAELLDEAARAATRGRATLVVAHRLSQAAACDRILVLDDGEVVEEGEHAALVAAGGAYARLWQAWSRPDPRESLSSHPLTVQDRSESASTQ